MTRESENTENHSTHLFLATKTLIVVFLSLSVIFCQFAILDNVYNTNTNTLISMQITMHNLIKLE